MKHGVGLDVAVACGIIVAANLIGAAEPLRQNEPAVRCADKASKDQDDMCLWKHPTDAGQSTIIVADKAAHRLFVYDLSGKTIQSLEIRHPGNIDLRYGFTLGKGKWDVVAVNLRTDRRIAVLGVNPETRCLERLDNGEIMTGENYGGGLFQSPKSGKLFFMATSYGGKVEQHELVDDGRGKIAGKLLRTWKIGLCEAAVADDETGRVYISQEQKGVWELPGEPDDESPPKLVVKLGEHGLTGDVEGLAIYRAGEGNGYLLVSNQASNNFKVYRRADHEYVGTFAIAGAQQTDGLDVCHAGLGDRFPSGLFACHTDAGGKCPVLLVRWEQIAESLPKPVEVKASQNRRD